jgi:serine/threonine-protein kinase HipA
VRECFIYIVPPGQTAFVRAARFQWLPDQGGLPLGRLVYGRRYLERRDAVPFDPLELPLTPATYETRGLGEVFGAVRDAAPDHWGRRVIQRQVAAVDLPEIDYLLQSPDDRAGALGFGLNAVPLGPKREFNQTADLANAGVPSVTMASAERGLQYQHGCDAPVA